MKGSTCLLVRAGQTPGLQAALLETACAVRWTRTGREPSPCTRPVATLTSDILAGWFLGVAGGTAGLAYGGPPCQPFSSGGFARPRPMSGT